MLTTSYTTRSIYGIICAGLFALSMAQPTQAFTSVTAQAIFKAVEKKQWGVARTLASNAGNHTLSTAVQWYYLTQSNDVMDADELMEFNKDHPEMPQRDKLLLRTELALIANNHGSQELASWFAKHPPITAHGELKLAEINNKVDVDTVMAAWIEGNFTDLEYRRLVTTYNTAIDTKAFAARVNRLLWDNKPSDAKELLVRLSSDQQALAMARIALQTNAGDASSKIAAVPKALQSDEGLQFDRLSWRINREDMKGAEEILLKHDGKNAKYPVKWWPMRKRVIREALNDKRYTVASKLANGHGLAGKDKTTREAMSEALFLKGWIDLVFMHKAASAHKDFTTLFENVSFPISSSRAAYWAARAAAAAGDKKEAEKWYKTAALYPTHFYGQIAYEQLHKGKPLPLPKDPNVTAQNKKQFLKDYPLARLVNELCAQNVGEYATPFLKELAHSAKNHTDAALTVHLSTCTKRQDMVVRTAKEVWQEHQVMVTSLSYPTVTLPKNMLLELEPALAFAITRQESMFYPKATSGSGARGLMQVMPNTGKLVAKEHGIPYNVNDLYQPTSNLRIGTAYLADLLEKMDGSYVMAVAGYNAGPGRPKKWADQFGRPNGNLEQTLNWIEMIPYGETRNYVMRVLENYHVYRSLLNTTAPLTAHKVAGR